MTNRLKNTCLILVLLLPFSLLAQATEHPEMADLMRQSGKIYVVIAVLTIIFAGIIFYLITIDRKVSGLEKKIQNNSEG